MLLRLYRGIGPGSILLLILTGVLLWMYQFINPVDIIEYYSDNAMPLYIFFDSLLGKSILARSLLGFILTLLIAFYLSNFNTRLFFITERTLLPSSFYVILSGFFVNLQTLNPILPATLLLFIALDRVVDSYRKSGIAYNYFDASLMLGIGSMFYFNIIWFFPVIIIGVLLIRTFNFREIFLALFGLIAPYLVAVAVYYITGNDLSLLRDQLVNNVLYTSSDYVWSTQVIISLSICALLIVISLVHLFGLYNTKKIKTRKVFSILIWLFVIGVGIYFIIPGSSEEMIYVVLIPVVYLFSHFIVFTRNKKIANIVFAIVFISVVVIQILRIYGM